MRSLGDLRNVPGTEVEGQRSIPNPKPNSFNRRLTTSIAYQDDPLAHWFLPRWFPDAEHGFLGAYLQLGCVCLVG